MKPYVRDTEKKPQRSFQSFSVWVPSPRGSWFHCSSEENVSKEVTGTVKTVLKDRESKLSLGALDVGHTARCLLLLHLAVGRFTAQRYLVDLKQFRESLS